MIRNSTRETSKARLERWKESLRKAGVKLTLQRLEIFRELAAHEDHPDAETLHRAVQRRAPTLSLDTVYRTLWLLHDLGLISSLGHRHEGMRFDTNVGRHHHYVCMRCGRILDFESDDLDALRLPDCLSELGAVHEARVEVRGVCARCLRDGAGSAHEGNCAEKRGGTGHD